jgi:hypothetical protein
MSANETALCEYPFREGPTTYLCQRQESSAVHEIGGIYFDHHFLSSRSARPDAGESGTIRPSGSRDAVSLVLAGTRAEETLDVIPSCEAGCYRNVEAVPRRHAEELHEDLAEFRGKIADVAIEWETTQKSASYGSEHHSSGPPGAWPLFTVGDAARRLREVIGQ